MMDSIYHEKQDGGFLCAQYCLNNLLQNFYFSADTLAEIARQLDSIESHFLTDSTTSSRPQKSENMDDTGMFSVQVLEKALEPFSIYLINLDSQEAPAKQAKANPTQFRAFVCNHEAHWITVRKLGNQWFNLDSLLTKPRLISDLYLSLYLQQLSLEGYSIFLVNGVLPSCQADEILSVVTVEQPRQVQTTPKAERHQVDEDEEDDLQAAIALSLQPADKLQSQESTCDECHSDSESTRTQSSQLSELSPVMELELEGDHTLSYNPNSILARDLKEKLLDRLGYSASDFHSHHVVLQVRNCRDSFIPVTAENIQSSSKRNPLHVTLIRRLSFIPHTPSISNERYEAKKAQMNRQLEMFAHRLDIVEDGIESLPERREDYFKTELEKISVNVRGLESVLEATNDLDWTGGIHRNPLW